MSKKPLRLEFKKGDEPIVPVGLFVNVKAEPYEVPLADLIKVGPCKIENDGEKCYFECESIEVFEELLLKARTAQKVKNRSQPREEHVVRNKEGKAIAVKG